MEFNAAPIQVTIRDLETMTCQFVQGGKPIDPLVALAGVACGVFSVDVANDYAEVNYRPGTPPLFIERTFHIFRGRSVVLVACDKPSHSD